MLLSRHQDAGQNPDIKIANKSFENVSQFKYLGTTVTNKNLFHEEIKRRLSSGNAYCHSVQSQKSKNENIHDKNFACVLYVCETWSLTLWDEHTLRVLENKVLRKIYGPKWDELTGGWRKLHNEELCSLYSSPSIIRII
jgi:hypothetical protein